MWYHLFYGSWVYQAFCAIALYYLWSIASTFDSAAHFVPLVNVVSILQSNLESCSDALRGVPLLY